MIKKLLLLLLLSPCAYAFSPIQYVQISTNTPLTTQQGGISISSVTASSSTLTTLTVSTITISCSSCGIVGVKDGSNAYTGNYGEYISSAAQSGTYNSAGNNVWTNIASISLTAGDWDLMGTVRPTTWGSATTRVLAAISINSGNTTTDHVASVNFVEGTVSSASFGSLTIPRYRLSLTSTTTIYLKFNFVFTGTTPAMGDGSVTARRIR